jgi:hypothetical protein
LIREHREKFKSGNGDFAHDLPLPDARTVAQNGPGVKRIIPQNKGVRCWFAPHDLATGAKTWDAIDEAIRLRDKLLLILSENSIAGDWVEDEVNKAFAEERERKQLVLFPVRLDDAVMATSEPWARKLRDQRNIGKWKDHVAYQKALEKLLRDLTASAAKQP